MPSRRGDREAMMPEHHIGGFMNMAFIAADVWDTYDELSARGVEFTQPTRTEPGDTSAIFSDPRR